MVNLFEILDRLRFWHRVDRIGPDIPLTHWKLYYKSTMRELCSKKFYHFGEGAEFRPGAYAINCSRISIGENVIIRPGTFLFSDESPSGGDIVVEDNVLMGAGVHIYTNNHLYVDSNKLIIDQGYPLQTKTDSVRLKIGCWIGAGSILLPGVTIGRGSVVGAGAVVTRSVPDFQVVAGVPAKLIKLIKKPE